MRSQYNVNKSSYMPFKYYYFSTLSLSTLLNLSHHDMTLKIPPLQILGYCIHKYAHTAISTSSLLCSWWPPKCGFRDPKMHSSLFYLGSKIANGSHCLSRALFPTVMEFLNSYQDRTNASMCLRIMLKNNDTAIE